MSLNYNMFLEEIKAVGGVLSDNLVIFLIVTIVIGLLECFFGYKLFEFVVSVICFVFLGGIGVMIVQQYTEIFIILLLVFLAIGTIGAIIAVKLYLIGVFLLSFSFGAGIGYAINSAIGSESLIIMLIAGVLLGIIGVFLVKHVIIIGTSISGGFAVGNAVAVLIHQKQFVIIIIGAILSIVGIVVQYKMDSKYPKYLGNKEKQIETIPTTSDKEDWVDQLRNEGDSLLESAEPKKGTDRGRNKK